MKKLEKEIQNLINNAMVKRGDMIGQEKMDKIGGKIGQYVKHIIEPALQHIENKKLPSVDDQFISMVFLTCAMVIQARLTGDLKNAPALTTYAKTMKLAE